MGTALDNRRGMIAALLTFAVVGVLAAFALTDHASAQSAFCQQYPDSSECQGEGPIGGGNGAGNEGTLGSGNVPSANAVDTGGAGSGNLPFTGYPMTTLVLLLSLLLALGFSLRLGIAVRDRTRRNTPTLQ